MRMGGGTLVEGRMIYEMIGGRALFSSTVARNKSRGFRVSSTRETIKAVDGHPVRHTAPLSAAVTPSGDTASSLTNSVSSG